MSAVLHLPWPIRSLPLCTLGLLMALVDTVAVVNTAESQVSGHVSVDLGCQSQQPNPFNTNIEVQLDAVDGFCGPGGVEATFLIHWIDPTPGIGGDFIVRGTQIPPCQPFGICPWGIATGTATTALFGSILPVCAPYHDAIQGYVGHWFVDVTVEKLGSLISPPCNPAEFPVEFCGDGVVQETEECDDGNTVAGDCCSADCRFEGAGSSCEPVDACSAPGSCDGSGTCLPGSPIDCDDDDICDGFETCDPALGCQAGTPLTCGDGVFCNGEETCDAQLGCQPGVPEACSDGTACTLDVCDLGSDSCIHLEIPDCPFGLPCDGDGCFSKDPCEIRYCDPVLNECVDQEVPDDCPQNPPCDGDPCLSEHPCEIRFCNVLTDQCESHFFKECYDTPPPITVPVPAATPPPPVVVPIPLPQPVSVTFHQSVGSGTLLGNFFPVPLSGPAPAAESGGLGFHLASDPGFFWYVAFTGTFEPPVEIGFDYDPAVLLPDVDEEELAVYRQDGARWSILASVVDAGNHRVTATTDSLSIYALGTRLVFGDGFESGDTSAWSASVP